VVGVISSPSPDVVTSKHGGQEGNTQIHQKLGDPASSTGVAGPAASGGGTSIMSRLKPAKKTARIDLSRRSKLEDYQAALIKLHSTRIWDAELGFLRRVLSTWCRLTKTESANTGT
jgi:hypothetical protein